MELNSNQYYSSLSSWEDSKNKLQLKSNLLKGIYSYGYETPSNIQKKAIPAICTKKDIIAQAQSGTGKTGAFTVSMLQLIDEESDKTQVILLSPTRELAKQSYNVIQSLSQYMNINVKLLIGGTNVREDKEIIRRHTPHIIVGCIGRVYDMIKTRNISTRHISMLVIDEADEMLSGNFKDQVYDIFQTLNQNIQIVLFSATLPKEVHEVTNKFMRDPIQLLIESSNLSLNGIKQFKIDLYNDKQKYETLKDLYEQLSLSQCIIYCNSVKRVYDLYNAMLDDDFPVTYIHSKMKYQDRTQHFNDFKDGKYRVLISSDITSRGIDVQQVSIVVNFDFCKNKHNYLHRIGRSGRWGRKGMAINFITKNDERNVKDMEDWYNIELEELPVDYMKFIQI